MFTENQKQILAVLINQPDREYYLSELGVILHKHPGVFSRGINSLQKQGLVASHKRGNQRLFKINKAHPLFNEVKGIVQKTCGAEGLLRDMVISVNGIDIALIYGSYAKDKMRSDSDIDILVVAADLAAENTLLRKIKGIEQKLQREVNYKFYSKREFLKKRKSRDPFLEDILSDKYILLKGAV